MKALLFLPLARIGTPVALMAGLAAMLCTALVAWQAGLTTAGVLTLGMAPATSAPQLIIQGLVNWLVVCLVLWGLGAWLAPGRFPVPALFAGQALARWPLLIAALYLAIAPVRARLAALNESVAAAEPTEPGQVIADTTALLDAIWLTLLGLPVLLAIAWMVWLMYHGYTRVTGLAGLPAFFSFVAALVFAHYASMGLALG